MKHLLLALATTALLLFSTTIAQDYVYDTFGDPLVAGGEYYVVPYDYSDVGGGFTWDEHKRLFSPCPEFYVNQVKDNTNFGQPTTFNPTSGTNKKITISASINIAFPKVSPPASLPVFCHASSNLWKVEDSKVLLGGQKGSSDSSFTIEELSTGGYKISFCGRSRSSCSGLGIDPSSDSRQLVLNGTSPIAVVFESEQFFLKRFAKNNAAA